MEAAATVLAPPMAAPGPLAGAAPQAATDKKEQDKELAAKAKAAAPFPVATTPVRAAQKGDYAPITGRRLHTWARRTGAPTN